MIRREQPLIAVPPHGRLDIDDARGRAVIARFDGGMISRGPAGILRLLKNTLRHATRREEHPASVISWHGALEDAGFAEVAVRPLRHEGGIATARQTG